MLTAQQSGTPFESDERDQRVIWCGATWSDYEALLAMRDDRPNPRLYYLEGEIEIMSPSEGHEWMKTTLARLLEAYADEVGLELNGYGSLAMRKARQARGAEPDECYVVGRAKGRPDLAIEVMWTKGGLDKLAIYSGLGVQELWCCRREKAKGISLALYALRRGRYFEVPRSGLLPHLDLELIRKCLALKSQTQAVRAFRAALRRTKQVR